MIWLWNVYLWFLFLTSPDAFNARRAAGEQCYIGLDPAMAQYLPMQGLGAPISETAPACWDGTPN